MGGGCTSTFSGKKVSDEPKKAANEFFTQSHILFDQTTYSQFYTNPLTGSSRGVDHGGLRGKVPPNN